MDFARVVGSAVATIKSDALKGHKLLVLRAADASDNLFGEPFVAVDAVGAGEGEFVLVSRGSSARQTTGTEAAPVDAVIMAILDSVELDGSTSFRKS
ncbi:EutN/CcmL family microcompartment protein [Tessaracoccus antarcticus]|uniref:Ethanolamine utilization protein EutN n=1 Tax=Tessaracoccus antarcticus TaxID=2479848 RepID=A0A3M0G3S2_9ACTN|nr:EutN/CcmL family microcompartment protein [Tessaracoccus antarcticus]RMB59611.1 ethanolamine utilization protein EutN [Tessaracoccus antarcticus]